MRLTLADFNVFILAILQKTIPKKRGVDFL